MSEPNGTTQCVVLAAGPHRQATEPPLAALLDARRWCASQAPDPLAALAELCLLERMGTVDRPWGEDPLHAPVLVLVEPVDETVDPMLSALRRYLPRVAVWRFSDGELSLHAAANNRDGTSRMPPVDDAAESDNDSANPTEITREEIAMLLDVNDEGEAP